MLDRYPKGTYPNGVPDDKAGRSATRNAQSRRDKEMDRLSVESGKLYTAMWSTFSKDAENMITGSMSAMDRALCGPVALFTCIGRLLDSGISGTIESIPYRRARIYIEQEMIRQRPDERIE